MIPIMIHRVSVVRSDIIYVIECTSEVWMLWISRQILQPCD